MLLLGYWEGEHAIFDRLDQRYPDAEPADRMAEALDAFYDIFSEDYYNQVLLENNVID